MGLGDPEPNPNPDPNPNPNPNPIPNPDQEEIADIFKSAGFGLTDDEFERIYEQATHLDAGGKVSVESFRKVLNGPTPTQPFVR